METPRPERDARKQLEADLARIKSLPEGTYSEPFTVELAKFEAEQRRRDGESRRLGNE